MMDESNLIIEYYIEPEAEKDRRRGQTFNWDTATYGKVRRMFEVRSPLIRELMLKFFNTCRFTDIELGLDVSGTFYLKIWRGLKRQMIWREFILALGLHTTEEMASERFGAYWAGSLRESATKADLRDYWTEISSTSDFMTGVPSYTAIRDPLRRLCHCLIAFNISGRSQAPEKERKKRSMMSRGHFIRCLAEHFRLLTKDRLRGLTLVGDAFTWVALRPEGQQDVVAGDAYMDLDIVDEGALAILAPA
nr:hypothetical protein [Tanacetum cinerariifolium]